MTLGASGITLAGNFIGTAASGNAALGNAADGVAIVQANGNSLLGTTFEQPPFVYYNVLSGNRGNGLRVTDSNSTTVQANFTGLGADNATVVANGRSGILVNGTSARTIVGGPIPLGNVNSGNNRYGIEVAGKTSGFLAFNGFVGMVAFGGAAPNRLDGIQITATGGNNTIRTCLVAGNFGNGIVLAGDATGVKVGRNVCRALLESGFEVYGTTRSPNSPLAGQGVKPVVCNSTIRADLDRAFRQTGANKVFVITDYFRAAKFSTVLEFRQGRDAIDAAGAAGVDHLIFMSVADAECFDRHTKHLKAKVTLEQYLRRSGIPFSILRPCAFFENLDDAANWNPLKKGVVTFLSIQDCKYCASYEIGRAAAIQFRNRSDWLGKSLDVIGWQGDLSQVAAALSKVRGAPLTRVNDHFQAPIWRSMLLTPGRTSIAGGPGRSSRLRKKPFVKPCPWPARQSSETGGQRGRPDAWQEGMWSR